MLLQISNNVNFNIQSNVRYSRFSVDNGFFFFLLQKQNFDLFLFSGNAVGTGVAMTYESENGPLLLRLVVQMSTKKQGMTWIAAMQKVKPPKTSEFLVLRNLLPA